MLWPERGDTWRNGAKPAQTAFAQVAMAISSFEPVTVAASHRQWENARAVLPDTIRVVEISSDDAWMRDVGPTFGIDKNGETRGVDWQFNAWGGIEGGIVMPVFNDPRDQAAMDLLTRLFPDRDVVGVKSREILLGGGNIHCITQQVPLGNQRS